MSLLNIGTQSSVTVRRLTDIVGLWCAAAYATLAFFARQPGEPSLFLFFALAACAGLPVFLLYFYVSRRGERVPFGRVLLWAAVFRACGLLGGPFFEDDFYRYLWDGYRFATTATPYGVAPEAFFADHSVPQLFKRVLDQINNPELPTIYAPVTQLVFLLGYWIYPGSVTVLQAILVLFDLVTITLLFRLTSVANVMLYAWCPLVVKEIAFTAHPDGVGICLLLAAIILSQKSRWRSAAVCLGLAAGAKVFALVLVPLVLLRAAAKYWILSAAVLLGLYAPFVLSGGTDMESFAVFAREWEFNSMLFAPFSEALGAFRTKALLGLGFAVLWISYAVSYRKSGGKVPRGDWLYGALFLISPVINPWYLLWLLPFAAIFPSAWAWTASLAVLISYVTGLNLDDYAMGPYQQPIWARVLEFVPILLAMGYDVRWRKQKVCHEIV